MLQTIHGKYTALSSKLTKQYLFVVVALAVMIPVAAVVLSKVLPAAAAASNSFYLTPTPVSIQSGKSFTLSLRINPSSPVAGVQSTISYDATKLQYVSGVLDTTTFATTISPLTQKSGTISFIVGNLSSGSVSTDSLVATFTFKALASSGTSSISMTPGTSDASTNASYAGNWTNPSVGNATINFVAATVTTCPTGQTGTPPNCVTPIVPCPTGYTGVAPNCVAPVQTCPSGQTGTPPNCKTPTPATCPTGQTGTPPNCKIIVVTTPADPSDTQSDDFSDSEDDAQTVAPVDAAPDNLTSVKSGTDSPNLTVDSVKAQFTSAAIELTTDKPTKVYIQYGTTRDYGQQTATSDYATSHKLVLDPSTLIPGETYYYSIVAYDADGNETQTNPQVIKTRGMYLEIHVKDKNGKAIKNTSVTLHSTPVTVKTDANGYAIFKDIIPGSHSLLYKSGGKTYTQPVNVANVVLTASGGQSTSQQLFTVRYPITTFSGLTILLIAIIVLIVIIILLIIFYLIRKKRQGVAVPTPVEPTVVVTGAPSASFTPPPAAPQPTNSYFNQNPMDENYSWQNPNQK